ncbi:MAG: hypothetical protein COA43_14810 [Robiginitomaculum sp.]|nr:MAG: hypothetical protein COA43_14810 [Robiginitomaculum sp.]
MINKIKNRFKSRCFDFVETNYKKIPFDKIKPAEFSLGNGDCHNNSVAAINGKRADKVWLVWGGKKDGCVHFINSNKGLFFDETWHDYQNQNYYIIRLIDPSEYEYIGDLLSTVKRMLFNINGTLFSRYFGMKKLHAWI